MPIPVGLNVWSRLVEDTFPYLDRVSSAFDSLWFPDHVQYADAKVAEGWSLLSYALARYPDKLCGHDVLCNSFRNPAHLAKMAATMQAISGGRVVVGIGAGWNEEEYRAYGWPFPSARVRIAQLSESIQLMRTMWRDAPAVFQGEHYRIDGAYCEPRPDPLPPIMVGGGGERYLLRVVAEQADWWNYVYHDRETYAHKQSVLQQHCRDVGRDYDEIVQALHLGILIADSEADLARMEADPSIRPRGGDTVAGTPQQVTETLLALVDQGAHRFHVHFHDVPSVEGSYLFAAAVMPHLQ